ncbi:YciI family protein [Nocardia sp. NPDC051750]|uniref:YciI family protein n=1 Tax=Nocardia sp. NPDC051750 TaxID=3364325 RepID=UPI00379FA517
MLNVFIDPTDPAVPDAWLRVSHDVAFADTVSRAGELVGGHVFADPSTNTVVRPLGGELSVTYGRPYLGAQTYARSYFVLDCENLARAVELAALHPAIRFGAAEIRPLMFPAGWEM